MFEPENVQERYFPEAPGTAICGWTSDGRLGACATVHLIETASPQMVRIVGMVRSDLRRRGIGDYLLHWSQAQTQALPGGTAAQDGRLLIATESLSDDADCLHRRHGFEQTFKELVMERACANRCRNFVIQRI